MHRIIFFLLILGCLHGCSKNSECEVQPDITLNSIDIPFERLEAQYQQFETQEDLVKFLNDHPLIRDYFFRSNEYPHDSILHQVIWDRINNPHFTDLIAETTQVFDDIEPLKEAFESAFAHLKHYYPEARIPKVQTIITGLDNDLYVSDSLIIIGLDYYLGPGAKYRPMGIPEYISRRYSRDFIVPSVMLLYGISNQYNQSDLDDRTLLAEMMAYGKSYYFAKRMMPCVHDSLFIGYTHEEITGVEKNQDLIWAHFLEEEILYETNHMTRRKYLDERPKTYEIGDACPGRIGTWVGWAIIRKYMEDHPEVTLQELMKNDNARQLFNQANYRPQRPGGIFG